MPWRGQLSWCVGRRPEKGQKMPDEHPKPARAAATGAVLIAACNQSPHELDHEMSVHDLPGGRVRLRVGSGHAGPARPQRAGVAGWCSGARRRGMRCDLYRMPKDRRNQTGTPWLTYDSVAYYIHWPARAVHTCASAHACGVSCTQARFLRARRERAYLLASSAAARSERTRVAIGQRLRHVLVSTRGHGHLSGGLGLATPPWASRPIREPRHTFPCRER